MNAESKLKILFLGDFNSPNTNSWIEGLIDAGVEVFKASARANGNDDIHPIGPVGFPARIRMLMGGNDVKKLIEKLNPDLIIAYRVTSYGYLAARASFHPLVIGAQNEQIIFLRKRSWWREKLLTYFAQYAIKKADLIHAWSSNVAEGLKKFGASENQILVMHRGISDDIFTPPKTRIVDLKRPKIVSTRSLYPEYKIDDLLKAFKIFCAKYPDALFTIIGEGSEKDALKKLAKSLGISKNVKFTGKLKQAEIAMILADSDIYVSLIRTEGLSSSLLEACACGVLPLVADIPASRAVVEPDKNGMLIQDGTIEDISQILCDAFENIELRKKCADLNPEIIRKKFSRKINIERFVSNYRELVEKSKDQV